MLLYDGLIAHDVLRWCLDAVNKGYRFAIEVDHPPREDWYEKLADRTWYEIDHRVAYEESESRAVTGKRYVTVRRDAGTPAPTDENGRYNGGMFIFLLDEQDYQVAFSVLDNVVSVKPFKTILGGSAVV